MAFAACVLEFEKRRAENIERRFDEGNPVLSLDSDGIACNSKDRAQAKKRRSNRRGAAFAFWMGAAAIDVRRFFHCFTLCAAVLFAGDHARAIGMSALCSVGHKFLPLHRCRADFETAAKQSPHSERKVFPVEPTSPGKVWRGGKKPCEALSLPGDLQGAGLYRADSFTI